MRRGGPGRRLLLIVEIRQRHAWQTLLNPTFDLAYGGLFFRRDERERGTGQLRTRRAPDAVNVILRGAGDVEVDDVPERSDVNPPGGDVGGDQDPVPAALETRERFRRWFCDRLP